MAEVDFSDFESAERWFKTQNAEVRSAMTSRAALRVLANVSRAEAKHVQPLAITLLRCTLTSAVRGSGRTADVEWWDNAARSAADSAARSATRSANSTADSPYSPADSPYSAAQSAAFSAARSADSAVYSAAYSADSAAQSAAFSAADSAVYSAADSAAHSAAHSATHWDSTNVSAGLNHRPLWSGADVPDAIQSSYNAFLTFLAADPNWQFFHDWYLAMWEGKWTDWDLAIEVAKIDGGIWEKGLEAVAEKIEQIQEELRKPDDDITPEPVAPSNVHKLFETAPVVQASMATLSETLALRIDAFDRMSRVNEPIPFVETFRTLPKTATKIANILAAGSEHDGTSKELAIEVGKLRAEVERLKIDLKAALDEIEELRTKPWYKSSSVLFAGVTIPTIFSALFLLSGGDDRLEDRWNNVGADIEFLRGKFWPGEEDQHSEPMRLELPDEFEV